MNELLNSMGLESHIKEFEEAEAQGVSTFTVLPSGVYRATVKELATFVTEKGATQLKVIVSIKPENQEITSYQNITKKDGNPNPIGTSVFKHILDALGEEGLTAKSGKIKGYAKEVDANCIMGMSNKPIMVLIRQVKEPGAQYEDSNEIDGYLRADGTNSKNENLVDDYIEKITKTPILIRKTKDKASSSSAGGTTDVQAAADIDSII